MNTQELVFKNADWFAGDYDFEAYASRHVPTGSRLVTLGNKRYLFEDTHEVPLVFTIGMGSGPNDWHASVWSFDGGPFHHLACYDVRTKEQAILWCTRMYRISILGGEYDKELAELYC